MAKINKIFVAISLILIISFVPNKISCKPSGHNSDLIDGNDFLSLFIDQNQSNLNDEIKYDDLDKSDNIYTFNNNNNNNNNKNSNNRKNTNKNIDLNDDINPLETIMSNEDELLTQDSSNYGQRLRERIQNQKYIPKLNHPSSNNNHNNNHNQYKKINNSDKLIDTKTDDNFNENSEKIISIESPSKKQIIKMVTSGSKIIFLEEMTPSLNDKNNNSKINTTKNHNQNNNKFNDTKNNSDDIQVISISVSSTVGRSKKNQNLRQRHEQERKSNDLMKLSSSTIETIPTINDNFTDNDDTNNNNNNNNIKNNNKNEFINRSHKSEFTIEEIEPVTQIDNVNDSVNGESTNIHSILAPPQNVINQSQSNNMPIINNINNRDMLNTNIDPTTIINRMERKQDKLVPFQTVIYHDTGFNKDGNAQPRSISYSSVGQSIDQLNAWKDLEGLLEAKENVSESLRKPPLASTLNQGGYNHETVSSKINHNHQQQNHHPKIYSQPEKVYSEPAKFYSEPAKMYGEPSKFYSEPSKIYSEPAKVYGQPEKQYGEPAKIYSEPSKVYSEPSKVYSEPAKVYGEPSKVYWPRPTTPTTTTTTATTKTTISPFTDRNQNGYNKLRNSSSSSSISNSRRVIFNLDKLPYDLLNAPESSKRLLVPDINSGRRLRPSNIESKSEGDIDYDNNDQNNGSKYQQNHSNNYHQQHHYINNNNNNNQQQQQYQQQNHQIPLQNNENLSISQMNIKNNNNNLNYQQNNNRGNNNNNIQGRDQQQSLLQHHHHSSSSVIYNRPDLVTDRPINNNNNNNNKYLSSSSVTENNINNIKNLYTQTPEQNYEIEESVSVMTNGRANGIVQPTRSSFSIKSDGISSSSSTTPTTTTNNSDDSKVGYVVEGRNFRKYRVEEKTDDGFIVGEYGVVSHNDGGVRGVRYTADSNINPSLIHQALMKFLSL